MQTKYKERTMKQLRKGQQAKETTTFNPDFADGAHQHRSRPSRGTVQSMGGGSRSKKPHHGHHKDKKSI